MKTNLTLEEREALLNKILCVAQENGLWTVYEEGDILPTPTIIEDFTG